MTTKHTPGPWKSIKQDIVGGHPLEYIGKWSGRSANAKLIAAAPDLLAACKLVYHKVCYPYIGDDTVKELRTVLKNAIQKAGAE